jgi:predicted PurR-regulated permease PerM
MAVAGIIGIIGMVVNVGKAGYESATQSNNLRDQIQQVKDNNESIKEKYQKLTSDITNQNVELQSEITKCMDKYITLSNAIKAAQDDFQTKFKALQMAGLIIIIFIFFILLLKQFNLIEPINQVLEYPFIKLWELIRINKKTS